jgi:hypothetical protein
MIDLSPLIENAGFDMASVDSATKTKLEMICQVLVCNLIRNVLVVVGTLKIAKRVTAKHFEQVSEIVNTLINLNMVDQPETKKINKKVKSGGTSLPSEYFGIDSGRYYQNVDHHSTEANEHVARSPLRFQEAGALKIKTGGTSLPSEYFGNDSGRYYQNVDHYSTEANEHVARSHLSFREQEAGGKRNTKTKKTKEIMTLTDVKALIAMCSPTKEKEKELKFANDALELIRASILYNLGELLRACDLLYDEFNNKKTNKSKATKEKEKVRTLDIKLIYAIIENNIQFRHMSRAA